MFDCFYHTEVEQYSGEIIMLPIDRILICSICDKDVIKEICICSSCENLLGHNDCMKEKIETQYICPYCFIKLEWPVKTK